MNRFNTLVMVGTLLFVGCGEKASPKIAPKIVTGPKASDEIDFGTIENSIYTNNYFGLSVKIPSEWSVQDQESKKKLTEMGMKMISQEDKNLKAAIKASELQTVNLFVVFQHPLGTPVIYNPSIVCYAERIRDAPGITRGKDYLFHIRRTLELGQMKITFPKEVTTEKLGGRDFDVLCSEMPLAGMTVQQKMYATIMKGYALLIAVSFTNEEEKTTLNDVLSTVTFK